MLCTYYIYINLKFIYIYYIYIYSISEQNIKEISQVYQHCIKNKVFH